MLGELREAVARTARELSAAGLVVEAQGNVSARERDRVAVTAAGAALGAATATAPAAIKAASRSIAAHAADGG